MRTFWLFILSFTTLYNAFNGAFVEARTIEFISHPMEVYDFEIDTIEIKTDNIIRDINDNLEAFYRLTNIFKEFKYHNTQLASKLLEKIQNNNTFSGDDLYLIKRTFDIFYKLNSKMMEMGNMYEMKSSLISSGFAKRQKIRTPVIKAQLIWVSANLMMLDHIREIHKILYLESASLRRTIKLSIADSQVDIEGERRLKILSQQINSVVEMGENKKFQQQVIFLRSIQEDLLKNLEDSPESIELLTIIMNNPTAIEMAQGKKKFEVPAFGLDDAVVGFFNRITNALSGLFGNVAGAIHWRKGYLHNNTEAILTLKERLRPMDIILEKSPFVLTDKFIPGHYGHVALYLGTKEQLLQMGMWNHPSLIPYQSDIENGKTILEAVRSGVRLNSIEGFMNIDEFSVVRKIEDNFSPNQISEQITRGIDQMGKAYDFNFDISTLDKVVCSELIYIVFGHVNWPTRYRLGRATITPDDIGEILFQKNTRFKMTDLVFSTQRHKVEKSDINYLANIYDFELRDKNGHEVTEPHNPENSFWKKETKCYTVTMNDHEDTTGIVDSKKQCKTTYKEFYYEEVGI